MAVLLSASFGFARAARAVSAALDHTLEDQFERRHELSSLFGSLPVVVVAGDQRATRGELKAWLAALKSPLSKRARLLGLAELDGVPFFIPNSTIRSKLAEEIPDVPVLCDWDNEVYERIGFSDDTLIAVAVYGPKGELREKVTGKHSSARMAQLLSKLG